MIKQKNVIYLNFSSQYIKLLKLYLKIYLNYIIHILFIAGKKEFESDLSNRIQEERPIFTRIFAYIFNVNIFVYNSISLQRKVIKSIKNNLNLNILRHKTQNIFI